MASTATAASSDVELAEFISQFYDDPYGFVLACYPWGEPGPLEHEQGPDTWQRELLERIGAKVRANRFNGTDPVMPIREAVSSGHGVGKSVFSAWITNWIMSTRPMAQGTITANSHTQLKTKTWAAILTWTKRCLTSHWFIVNSDMMYHKDFKSEWFCSRQSSRKENSEAFAGQHAKSSTSFYVFDESSGIEEGTKDEHGNGSDDVFTVAEGGLTDGEPMYFLFGNCTKRTGKFYRACFGSERSQWGVTVVDSRSSRFSNKALIQSWADTYGEDSDFFRVRVTGQAPNASDAQFIPSDWVTAAQTRQPMGFSDEPLVCGLDVARGGGDRCVFRFRRGNDARSIRPVVIPGEEMRDSMRLVTKAAALLEEYPIAMMFVDGTGIGGPIVNRLHQMGHRNVIEVQFGAEAPDEKMLNMRAHMWNKMREWLRHGAIDDSSRLETDLTEPGYGHKHQKGMDRLVIESKDSMKARGVDSPDDGDALALTFASVVKPKRVVSSAPRPLMTEAGWMG